MNQKQLEAIQKQEQLRSLVEQKQKLDSQMNETLMANDEIKLLEDDAIVYKLIGPLMVPQNLDEVRSTMKSRLKFLEDRINYHEIEIKKLSS